MRKLIIKLIAVILSRWDFLLVARQGSEGFVLMTPEGEGFMAMRAILQSAFRNDNEDMKNFFLDVTADWLKDRVIETKNFIERIK